MKQLVIGMVAGGAAGISFACASFPLFYLLKSYAEFDEVNAPLLKLLIVCLTSGIVFTSILISLWLWARRSE